MNGLPDTLVVEVGIAHSWLRQMLAQLEGEAAWEIEVGDDPMASVRAIDALRVPLAAAGLVVPPIRDAETDPLGNMLDWRDFLAELVTVH